MNILVLCENKGNLKNVHPILKSLEKQTDINIFYFNLDMFFHQNTRIDFIYNQVITMPLVFKTIFYNQNKIARLNALRLLKKNINIKSNIDLIIAGSFGVIEYTIAKEIIKLNSNCKLVFIQDSILLQTEKYYKSDYLNTFRNWYYGNNPRQNICDIIFVSGMATKNVLVSDGVFKQKLKITGIPRFSYLFEHNQMAVTQKKKLLILMGANEWHGYKKDLASFEKYVINKIGSLAVNNTIPYRVAIRPHPRGNKGIPNKLNMVEENTSSISVNNSIRGSDIVVSIGYPSTSLFESILLGKDVYLINNKDIDYKVYDKDIYEKTIFVLSLEDFITNLQNDSISQNIGTDIYNNNIGHFIFDQTPNSSKNIADQILQLMQTNLIANA